MKLRALLVDDERLARAELTTLLTEFPEIEIVGEAANAKEALDKIDKLLPDLLFLDIQMPGKTGFDLLAELDNTPPHVIFVTAYDEYALKAFEVNALDYLQKPVDAKRLADAVQKLRVKEERQDARSEVNKSMLTEDDQVFVKDGERCWFVKLNEVRLFESVGNYARVYFGPNKPLILKSLNSLEERLDEKVFFRANRKEIVNLRMVEKVEPYFNGGLLLELKGGDKVEVSRRQGVKFKDMMSL